MKEWDDKYNFCLSMIDEEHKIFIDINNKAFVASKHKDNIEETEEVIGEMLEYSDKHFSTEEAYMIKFKFPEYQWHRNEHLDFTDKAIKSYNKLISGNSQIANELLEYLKRWLVHHIEEIDKKYVDYFKENGLK